MPLCAAARAQSPAGNRRGRFLAALALLSPGHRRGPARSGRRAACPGMSSPARRRRTRATQPSVSLPDFSVPRWTSAAHRDGVLVQHYLAFEEVDVTDPQGGGLTPSAGRPYRATAPAIGTGPPRLRAPEAAQPSSRYSSVSTRAGSLTPRAALRAKRRSFTASSRIRARTSYAVLTTVPLRRPAISATHH